MYIRPVNCWLSTVIVPSHVRKRFLSGYYPSCFALCLFVPLFCVCLSDSEYDIPSEEYPSKVQSERNKFGYKQPQVSAYRFETHILKI